MKKGLTAPLHTPVTPLERRLIHKHNLPGHWARSLSDLLAGHR